MRFLVLQHISCEPPAVYEDVLRDRHAEIVRVELDEGERPPDWRGFDAIIAMGGPMSANDDKDLPWLRDEKRLISEAVRNGTPYWGVCLGCQLLAASLGARVYRGPVPEVGVLEVRLTAQGQNDPVFGKAPREFLSLQWHNDTFEIPAGGVPLASSSAYDAQAFRWGPHAYGLQFHLEVSPELAREWARVPAYANDLSAVLGANALPTLISEIEASASRVNSLARTLFEGWLTKIAPSTRSAAS